MYLVEADMDAISEEKDWKNWRIQNSFSKNRKTSTKIRILGLIKEEIASRITIVSVYKCHGRFSFELEDLVVSH